MKKSRVISMTFLAIFILLAAALFLLVQNLDTLVKAAVEKYGSEAAGTPVRVEEVEIDLKAGAGAIRDLTVANPQGFAPEPLFVLDEIALALDPTTLTSEMPVIETIAVGSPSFLYQIDKAGNSNLQIVKKNLESRAGTAKEQEKAGHEEAVRLLVKQLTISGGSGVVDLTAIGGKRFEATMPPISLRNIGGEKGVTPAGLGEVVLQELVRKLEQSAARQAAEKAVREKVDEKAGEFRERLDEKLGPEAGETLKNILGR